VAIATPSINLPFGLGNVGGLFGRKLLQAAAGAEAVDKIAVAHFSVRAADPAAATEKLLGSFANNGEAFYDALDAAGVPFQPAVSVGGQQLLTGSVTTGDVITGRERGVAGNASVYDPRDLQLNPSPRAPAPAATAPAASSSGLSTGALIGIIIGAVVGGLLLFGLMIFFCCCKGRSPAAQERRKQKEREAAAKAAAAAAKSADIEAGGADQKPRNDALPYSSIAAAATGNSTSPRMPSNKAPRPSLTGYATDLEDVAPRDHRDQKL
jgi:hypothetical protein